MMMMMMMIMMMITMTMMIKNDGDDDDALGPYVLYMSARFYPILTSFTSYIVAPAQTYML